MNSVNLKASVSFVGDGSTNRFYFGFDYINKQFVKVQVGADNSPLTYLTDYTVDDRSVTLTDTPDVGVAIRVYRETPSDRIVEWADGAFIKASQMTLESLQQLHLIEEAQDYPILSSLSRYPDGINFNALNSRITGVSDPKDPQDAVTKHYMENVQGGCIAENTKILNEAKDTLSATQQTQSKAQANETLSKAWATSTESPDNADDTQSSTGKTQSSRSWALHSEGKAQESATSEAHAKTSETNAKTSETNAKASEINAETAENNAGSYSGSAYSSYIKSRDWAESTGSPDDENDSFSTTGKTRSARGWAMQAKEYAGSLNLSFILDSLLPVGTVYMTENANFDPNNAWGVGVWVKTAINRVLQGTNDKSKVGTTIDAGLPNITGGVYGLIANNDSSLQGALHIGGNDNVGTLIHSTQDTGRVTVDIDASRSSSIYGNSDTVQPPAELVFIWKRIS